MALFDKFADALPDADFMSKYGNDAYEAKWRATYDLVTLTPAQRELLGKFRGETNVLVLAGAWYGDCASQCPIFDRFAGAAPVLKVRYLDRDEHGDAQARLQIKGGDRIPVVVFFSEDGYEVSRYGERTLSKYQDLVEKQTGETCASGIAVP